MTMLYQTGRARRSAWIERMPPERVLTRPFVLAVLAILGVSFPIGMLLPVLPLFAKGPLGTGSIGVGIAIAAASPTALLVQPLAGRLADRRGRRILVIVGPLIVAASVATYTFVDTLAVLVLLRLVTGIGEGMVFVGAATVVTDVAPEERRGEAVSLYSLGVWGGLAIGPVVGEAIHSHRSYDAVWFAAAGCALGSALAGVSLRETKPATAETPQSRLIHPAALAPGLVLIASALGFAGFNAFVALYARELGLSGAGWVFFVYSAIVISIRIFGRRLPDRLGAKRASGAALGLLAVGLLTIGLWQTPVGLYLGTAVFAAGTALAFPALLTLAVDRAEVSERSSVIGTFSACIDVGFALGALSLGAVASVTGYSGVFVAAAFAAVAGAFVLFRIPTQLRVRAAEAS
jgi:MFS family permease